MLGWLMQLVVVLSLVKGSHQPHKPLVCQVGHDPRDTFEKVWV